MGTLFIRKRKALDAVEKLNVDNSGGLDCVEIIKKGGKAVDEW